ncbi:hypothetical protein CA236_07190 [Sphingomonas sp. ABOLG]|uniref:AAA family ATPase n=1 Tax=Sphingomonas sp. ABOLG TaxID=1985880 RepID=UPI000F7EA03A|nr:AAA family ATPase [Sphingomonas sp. ABOLG]RSV18395.1 hypothetical protein CA236_07190 [Sphingomonas sp. ABOLG]
MADDVLKWDATTPPGHWLASNDLAEATSRVPFRIDGWLASVGTSVWFGAGSTGKTQLLLWMAATIASRQRPATWLGREVHGTGHVLILTAEDSRKQIVGRLRDVVRHTLGQDDATAQETCGRLHVMPFLSMDEEEFQHPNASLMQLGLDRLWEPTPVLLEIRRYIEDWNDRQAAAEDKIVGVVMDSATSMAGFDTIDGHATTNFFFYVGRMCEALGIFWTVIGHQPKSVTIGKDPRLNAAARLRGAAMWTTAPRMTVEVRLIQEWQKVREAAHIRNDHPERRREDFVVVYVAKASLPGVHTEERYLLRQSEGAFIDVTRPAPASVRKEIEDRVADENNRSKTFDDVAGEEKRVREWAKGTSLVLEAIRALFPDAKPGTLVPASAVMKHCQTQFAGRPESALVKTANGGGETAAREGAVNWHMDRLVERSILTKQGSRFRFVAWDQDDRIAALIPEKCGNHVLERPSAQAEQQ